MRIAIETCIFSNVIACCLIVGVSCRDLEADFGPARTSIFGAQFGELKNGKMDGYTLAYAVKNNAWKNDK